jgi:hypothetical protein
LTTKTKRSERLHAHPTLGIETRGANSSAWGRALTWDQLGCSPASSWANRVAAEQAPAILRKPAVLAPSNALSPEQVAYRIEQDLRSQRLH